ncbi:MAG: hypothetical protein U9O87_04835 [Verrucomicrobiota bacterium]|nr:hypothetical protein [Verrucomicrobiota bacterium]
MFEIMQDIYLSNPIAKYISQIVAATHPNSQYATTEIKQYISFGASPRAAIAIAEASRAMALINERPTVGFEDVNAVALHALNHRIILNYKARFDKVTESAIIENLLESIDEAEMNIPSSIKIGE